MRTHRFAPLLLILAAAVAAPATAQGVPDEIPDDPEESLADREERRLIERYRGALGQFFGMGGFAVAPATGPVGGGGGRKNPSRSRISGRSLTLPGL